MDRISYHSGGPAADGNRNATAANDRSAACAKRNPDSAAGAGSNGDRHSCSQ